MSNLCLLARIAVMDLRQLGLQYSLMTLDTAPVWARHCSNSSSIIFGKRNRSLYGSSGMQLLANNVNVPQSIVHPSLFYTTRHNISIKSSIHCAGKSERKSSAALSEPEIFGNTSNLTLLSKFKLMYKKYWYVLIPVHVASSIGWFGAFYYLSKSGVDIPAMLHYIHLSENIINKVQHSDMGHYAIAYLCYKIATPLRYAVTLGWTTVSIKYLVQMGYIKPIPSKDEIIRMYERKKASRAAAKAEKDKQDD